MRNIAAAFVFFTRLPFGRLKAFQVDAKYFSNVVNNWAIVGWLTGGVMAGTLWLSSQVFHFSIAVVLALLSRLLVTGALHEDGLADFLDGFGGGTSKERILAIMKDSHIGTYGVIGLIFYFLFFYQFFLLLPSPIIYPTILIADPLCKLIASQITHFLPYARTAETSKSGVIYNNMGWKTLIVSSFFGLLPLVLSPNIKFLWAVIFPVIVFFGLVYLMKKKINGYTGDCCGALFLLCELSFYLGIIMLTNSYLS